MKRLLGWTNVYRHPGGSRSNGKFYRTKRQALADINLKALQAGRYVGPVRAAKEEP